MDLANFLKPKKELLLKLGDEYRVRIHWRRSEREVEVRIVELEGDPVVCAVIGGSTTTLLKVGKRVMVSRSRFSAENKIN